jgi:WD40 repeat protein
MSSFRPRRALLGHKDRCFDVAFRPRRHLLAERRAVPAVPGGDDEAMPLEESSSSSTSYVPHVLATASEDCTARVWRVTGSECRCERVLGGHKAEVLRVAWAPPSVCGGNLLATGSADGAARIWRVKVGGSDQESASGSGGGGGGGGGGGSGSSSSIRSGGMAVDGEGDGGEDEDGWPEGDASTHRPLELRRGGGDIGGGDIGADAQVYCCMFSDPAAHATQHGPMFLTTADDVVQCWDVERLLSTRRQRLRFEKQQQQQEQQQPPAPSGGTKPPHPPVGGGGDNGQPTNGSSGSISGSSGSSGSSSNDNEGGGDLDEVMSPVSPPRASREFGGGGGGGTGTGGDPTTGEPLPWNSPAPPAPGQAPSSSSSSNNNSSIHNPLALPQLPQYESTWWRYEALALAPVFGGEARNEGNQAFVFDLALSNSSGAGATHSLLAAALSDGSARISSFAGCSGGGSDGGGRRAAMVAVLETEHVGHLTGVAWADDGLTLATTCGDGTALGAVARFSAAFTSARPSAPSSSTLAGAATLAAPAPGQAGYGGLPGCRGGRGRRRSRRAS